MQVFRKIFCGTALLAWLVGLAHGAGDPARGSRVFGQCAACHSVAPGEHLTGPSLAKVWNQKAASAEGFSRYSEALKRADVLWTEAALDAWLVKPEKFLPGTGMTFPGLKEAKDRQDVIAYLRAVSEGKAPHGRQGRHGMATMSPRKHDRRQAPAVGEATSIAQLARTLTVATAD